MRDTLPKSIIVKECGIVNVDVNDGEGTHWTAYIKDRQEKIKFDSYGNLPPPIELLKYFCSRVSNINIIYNYDFVQNFNSYKCGHYFYITIVRPKFCLES